MQTVKTAAELEQLVRELVPGRFSLERDPKGHVYLNRDAEGDLPALEIGLAGDVATAVTEGWRKEGAEPTGRLTLNGVFKLVDRKRFRAFRREGRKNPELKAWRERQRLRRQLAGIAQKFYNDAAVLAAKIGNDEQTVVKDLEEYFGEFDNSIKGLAERDAEPTAGSNGKAVDKAAASAAADVPPPPARKGAAKKGASKAAAKKATAKATDKDVAPLPKA